MFCECSMCVFSLKMTFCVQSFLFLLDLTVTWYMTLICKQLTFSERLEIMQQLQVELVGVQVIFFFVFFIVHSIFSMQLSWIFCAVHLILGSVFRWIWWTFNLYSFFPSVFIVQWVELDDVFFLLYCLIQCGVNVMFVDYETALNNRFFFFSGKLPFKQASTKQCYRKRIILYLKPPYKWQNEYRSNIHKTHRQTLPDIKQIAQNIQQSVEKFSVR